MAIFCLIHGGAQNAEGWKLLREELARRGHKSVVVYLPLARPELSAEGYADEIARQCLGQCGQGTGDLIAVAHSVSGLFLPLLANRLPLRAMVYVAAALPKPGSSAVDQVKSDAGMINPAWIGKDTGNAVVAREFLFHDCPDHLLPWALSTIIRFNPQRAIEEITPLKAWPLMRVAYVACLDDRTLLPAWQRCASRERLGAGLYFCPAVIALTLQGLWRPQTLFSAFSAKVRGSMMVPTTIRQLHAAIHDCVPLPSASTAGAKLNIHSSAPL